MGQVTIYQEVVDNALAATQAQLVVLTRFDASSGQVETIAWAGLHRAVVERAAGMVRAFWPGFDVVHFVFPAETNPALRRGYREGATFSASLREVAAGLVDERVLAIATEVAQIRACFQHPLLIEGQVEGALVFFTTREVDAGGQRVCAAFARQAALTLENARLLEQARRVGAEQEAVLDATDDAVVVFGRDGRIGRTNRAARELMVELVGRPVETLAEFNQAVRSSPPDEAPGPTGVISGALAGEPVSRLLIMAGASGRSRRVHVHAAPLRDAAGQVVGGLIVARDLTALHDALVERGRLDGAIKTARLVAHQLNNQLSLLTGYGELLAEDGDGDTAQFARAIVRGANASAETIARLQRIIRFEEVEGGADYPMLDLDASTEP